MKKVLTDLQRLRQDLLTYYDPYVRPVLNASKMTELTMQLPLSYITLVGASAGRVNLLNDFEYFRMNIGPLWK